MLPTDEQIVTMLADKNVPAGFHAECIAIIRHRMEKNQSTLIDAVTFVVKWVKLAS